MGDTITIQTSSSTDVVKIIERGPQGPAGPALTTLTQTGDMLYRDGTGGQRLPIGTSGQVLKVANGIPAWANESGAVTSVNTQTGNVSLSQANIPTEQINFLLDDSTSPASIDLTQYRVADYGFDVHLRLVSEANPGQATVILPQLGPEELGRFALQTDIAGSQFTCTARVLAIDPQEPQGTIPVYPPSGFDEPTLMTNHVFLWTGSRWDLQLLHKEATKSTNLVNYDIRKPYYNGTLAAWRAEGIPLTPTASGVAGQMAWGYDDEAERLYICVANNTWRRVPIASW